MDKASILIVGTSRGLLRLSGDTGFTCLQVNDFAEAARELGGGREFQLLLISMSGIRQDPFPLIREFMECNPSSKVMVFGNHDELQSTLSWLAGLSSGELRRFVDPQPIRPAESPLPQASLIPGFKGLIGESTEMEKLKKLLLKIAPTGTTILLQGESGTGKEVIARAIHQNSSRKSESFIPVDCAAINGSIIESELFGHAKGAFTGADRSTLGMIRSADKGTLFLDEIGELPLNMQAKLLRTLQERAVKPVGDTRIYPVDIRIIAATNRNLSEAVKNGEFREDLYYRLNAITIYAPPLRERVSDIPLISIHILEKLVQEGYPRKWFSEDALASMCTYLWPGNVRELENVVRRAATLAGTEVIDHDLLAIGNNDAGLPDTSASGFASIAFHEKDAIMKALQKTSGNRRAAAELLGISEATLYRRLKAYGL